MKKYILSVLLLCTVILFYSCDAFKTTSPEDKLKERINLLMTAKINGEWDKAYDFFDTNFKNKIQKKTFATPKKIIFLSYNIASLKMDASQKMADVLIKSSVEISGYTLKDAPENQHWIIENKKWFLAAKPITGFID